MKKRIFGVLLLLPMALFAQQKHRGADLNTVFVCLDSLTYSKLFEVPFVHDTLFFCREQSTNTNADNYTGKYFIGNAGTLEFFKPKSATKIGDRFGDLGIEFKTRQRSNLPNYVKTARQNKIPTSVETITADWDDKKINWYKELNIKYDTVPGRFALSVIEYQKEYLLAQGFTSAEIAAPMSYAQYNAKLSGGRKYPRQFNTIRKLQIRLNPNELEYLKQVMKVLGFKKNYNSFAGEDITIAYTVVPKSNFRLDSVEIDLLNNLPARNITIDGHLKLHVKNNRAVLSFLYN